MGYNKTQSTCKADTSLSVILDIFSRYGVGWMVAHREQAVLAQRLIADSCKKEAIKPEQLVIHADRGSSMTSRGLWRFSRVRSRQVFCLIWE